MVKEQETQPFRIIAHRCRGFGEPENTEAALWCALCSPADEIEVDVRNTKDRRVVVYHDPEYRDAQGTTWTISRTPLFRLERAGLMSLDTLLRIFKHQGAGKLLNVDVKTPGLEQELIAAIRHHSLEDRVIVVSWIGSTLEKVHSLAPELQLGLSFAPKLRSNHGNGRPYPAAVRLPLLLRQGRIPIKTVNLAPVTFSVSQSLVNRLRRCGVQVVVCNVDTPEANDRLAKIGVSATMTNRPLEIYTHFKRA